MLGIDLSSAVAIGIDQSLVGTALAVVQNRRVVYYHGWTDVQKLARENPQYLSFYKIAEQSLTARTERVEFVSSWILNRVDDWSYKTEDLFVALEDYAVSRLSNRSSDLHELGGQIKIGLWNRQTPFRIYNPTTLKSAWTGNGKADKDEMIEIAEEVGDLDLLPFKKAADNIADAVLIALLLWYELEIKSGARSLSSVPIGVSNILTRVSQKEKTPLSHRPFVTGATTTTPRYGEFGRGYCGDL